MCSHFSIPGRFARFLTILNQLYTLFCIRFDEIRVAYNLLPMFKENAGRYNMTAIENSCGVGNENGYYEESCKGEPLTMVRMLIRVDAVFTRLPNLFPRYFIENFYILMFFLLD